MRSILMTWVLLALVLAVTGERFTIGRDTLQVEHQGKHVCFCCPGRRRAATRI